MGNTGRGGDGCRSKILKEATEMGWDPERGVSGG